MGSQRRTAPTGSETESGQPKFGAIAGGSGVEHDVVGKKLSTSGGSQSSHGGGYAIDDGATQHQAKTHAGEDSKMRPKNTYRAEKQVKYGRVAD